MDYVETAEADFDSADVNVMTPVSLHLDYSPKPSSAAEAATTDGKYRDGIKGRSHLLTSCGVIPKDPMTGYLCGTNIDSASFTANTAIPLRRPRISIPFAAI